MHRRNFFLSAGAASAMLAMDSTAGTVPPTPRQAKAQVLAMAAYFEKRPKAAAALVSFVQAWNSAVSWDDDPPWCGTPPRIVFFPVFPPRDFGRQKWIDAVEVLGNDVRKMSLPALLTRLASSNALTANTAITFNANGGAMVAR
jgi:hypothetical protein